MITLFVIFLFTNLVSRFKYIFDSSVIMPWVDKIRSFTFTPWLSKINSWKINIFEWFDFFGKIHRSKIERELLIWWCRSLQPLELLIMNTFSSSCFLISLSHFKFGQNLAVHTWREFRIWIAKVIFSLYDYFFSLSTCQV